MAKLVFDYDGTLHDSLGIYAPAFRRVYAWLVARGFAPLRNFSDAEIGQWLGWTTKEMWDAFMPELPAKLKGACADFVGRTMLWGIDNGDARLYDGVEEMLARLQEQGHTLIFLSNCRHAYLEAHRAAFGLDRFFAGFYCAEDFGGAGKPAVFEQIRRDFDGASGRRGERGATGATGIIATGEGRGEGEPDGFLGDYSLGDYIAIGDRFHDIELAKSGSMPSIGCLYGFGSREELATATVLVDEPAQIVGAVERIAASAKA